MAKDIRKGFYKAFQRAGDGFLAYRLTRIFTKIETEEQRILHNDALADVVKIIQGDERSLYAGMVDILLRPRVNRRKRFLFRLAENILRIGQKKGPE